MYCQVVIKDNTVQVSIKYFTLVYHPTVFLFLQYFYTIVIMMHTIKLFIWQLFVISSRVSVFHSLGVCLHCTVLSILAKLISIVFSKKSFRNQSMVDRPFQFQLNFEKILMDKSFQVIFTKYTFILKSSILHSFTEKCGLIWRWHK